MFAVCCMLHAVFLLGGTCRDVREFVICWVSAQKRPFLTGFVACLFLLVDACRDLRGFVRSVRFDEGLAALADGDHEGQQLARSGSRQCRIMSGFALQDSVCLLSRLARFECSIK